VVLGAAVAVVLVECFIVFAEACRLALLRESLVLLLCEWCAASTV
jgi:hypothetical protein